MGKSSRRYFHHNDTERNHSQSSAGHRSSNQSEGRKNSYEENKLASERLKNSIQSQLANACKSDDQLKGSRLNPHSSASSKINLSIEDQIKIVDQIDEINASESFKPKNFFSSRTHNYKNDTKSNQTVIDLSEIPLPKNMSSWRENPKLLYSKKVGEKKAGKLL